jgi:hypothetical protein
MAIKTITISFKNTPEDIALYSWITSHSNLSGFIKDTLRATREGQIKGNSGKVVQEHKVLGLIDMDF